MLMLLAGPRRRRLLWALAGLAALGLAATLVIDALRSNVVFFFTPTEVARGSAPVTRTFRIGGLVETGSLVRGEGLQVSFRVTDGAHTIVVRYDGALPDLFAEGQGVVAQGRLAADGSFVAHEVLAKHDETYMPPEAADALRRAGHPSDGAQPSASRPAAEAWIPPPATVKGEPAEPRR